jgi:hypothetical protein
MESSASLEGAPVSQYQSLNRGGRVFEARPLTMKRCAALFHRAVAGERGALSDSTMTYGNAGGAGQRLELIESMAQSVF